MPRKSQFVKFSMLDPSTTIEMFSIEFDSIPALSKWLNGKGLKGSYTQLYRWLCGKTLAPSWYNPLVYKISLSSNDTVGLDLELRVCEEEQE